MNEAVGRVEDFVQERRPRLIATANAEMVMIAAGDTELAAILGNDPIEEIFERADGPADDGPAVLRQVALDARNLGPVRDDEHRIARQVGNVAVEQEGDFAGVRGPRDPPSGPQAPYRGGWVGGASARAG